MRERAEAMLKIAEILDALPEETRVLVAGDTCLSYGKHVSGHVSGHPAGHVFLANGGKGGSRGSSPKGKNLELQEKAIEILNFLNEKTGRSYRPVEQNLRFIRARLNTCSVEDCKGVIARKTRVWTGTPQEVFLRPKTLFNETNFEQYIGEQKRDG